MWKLFQKQRKRKQGGQKGEGEATNYCITAVDNAPEVLELTYLLTEQNLLSLLEQKSICSAVITGGRRDEPALPIS